MLRCTICRAAVSPPGVVCPFHGFTSPLACDACGRPVERGLSQCPSCDRPQLHVELVPLPQIPGHIPPGGSTALQYPRIDIPPPVPAVYASKKFGVEAEVTLNGRDAELLTKMGQVAALLQALANQMNSFQGLMDSTRRVIKGCRTLAIDLQEEIEIRRGPQDQ